MMETMPTTHAVTIAGLIGWIKKHYEPRPAGSIDLAQVNLQTNTIFRGGDYVFGPIARQDIPKEYRRFLADRSPSKVHPSLES